jgi:hypothetical protein
MSAGCRQLILSHDDEGDHRERVIAFRYKEAPPAKVRAFFSWSESQHQRMPDGTNRPKMIVKSASDSSKISKIACPLLIAHWPADERSNHLAIKTIAMTSRTR